MKRILRFHLPALIAVFALTFALGFAMPAVVDAAPEGPPGGGCTDETVYECNCGGWFEKIVKCGDTIKSRTCTNYPCP